MDKGGTNMLDYSVILFATSKKPDVLEEVEICSSLSCRALRLRICQVVKEKMERTRLLLIRQETSSQTGSRGRTIDFEVLDENLPVCSIDMKGTKIFLEILEEGCKEWPMDAFLKQPEPEEVVPPLDPSIAPLPQVHKGGGSFQPPPQPHRARPVSPPNFTVHSPQVGRKDPQDLIAQQMRNELSSFFATQVTIPQEPSAEELQITAAMALSREEAKKETEKENSFQDRLLTERGFVVKKMANDGNCLFAAVSDQVYGEPTHHQQLRDACVDYMEANAERFWQFVSGEEFDHYLARKRQRGVYGNNPEIQALSELIERPIEVFCYDTLPMNTFQDRHGGDRPVRISYHNNNHYNSLLSTVDESSASTPPSPFEFLHRKGIEPKEHKQTVIPPTHSHQPTPSSSSSSSTSSSQPSSSTSSSAPKPVTPPSSTSSAFSNDLFVCPQCQTPADNFEELQIHMLTVCGVEF